MHGTSTSGRTMWKLADISMGEVTLDHKLLYSLCSSSKPQRNRKWSPSLLIFSLISCTRKLYSMFLLWSTVYILRNHARLPLINTLGFRLIWTIFTCWGRNHDSFERSFALYVMRNHHCLLLLDQRFYLNCRHEHKESNHLCMCSLARFTYSFRERMSAATQCMLLWYWVHE